MGTHGGTPARPPRLGLGFELEGQASLFGDLLLGVQGACRVLQTGSVDLLRAHKRAVSLVEFIPIHALTAAFCSENFTFQLSVPSGSHAARECNMQLGRFGCSFAL